MHVRLPRARHRRMHRSCADAIDTPRSCTPQLLQHRSGLNVQPEFSFASRPLLFSVPSSERLSNLQQEGLQPPGKKVSRYERFWRQTRLLAVDAVATAKNSTDGSRQPRRNMTRTHGRKHSGRVGADAKGMRQGKWTARTKDRMDRTGRAGKVRDRRKQGATL